MIKPHYRQYYFKWQIKAGKYGAQQDLWMYQDFIKAEDTVLDFGCGGGYMLEKIKCGDKYGVDINPFAREVVAKKGIKAYAKLQAIATNIKFDVIISHHTLEHLPNPFGTLKDLYPRLKKNGLIICVVPIDDWRAQNKYFTRDINKHLFTWTPLLLGNLFSLAGYKLKRVETISRAWLPLSRFYYSYIPRHIYNIFSGLWSRLTLSRQIRIIGVRKTP